MTPLDDDALFDFPCEFPVKAMGRALIGFDTTVVEIVRRHVPDLGEGAVRCQESSGGKFLSVTVTITATSRTQLDAIYRDLTECDAVVMAL